MKLNKRYIRNIRANLPFYISATAITMVTLLMFYLFFLSGVGIHRYGDEFFKRNELESASFTCYGDISENEIVELEKRYKLSLEKEHFVNIDEGRFRARIFIQNERISKPEIIKGRQISQRNEILISAGYAEENKVKLNDALSINGREYRVCGIFLRPDYLYMLENLTDDYKNVSEFFIAYMDRQEFSEQFKDGNINYKLKYGENSDEYGFRKHINKNYYISSFTPADENMRISFVHEQANMFLLTAWIILFTVPIIAVALISIMISRRIKSEQKIIGTLSALGYSKLRLMKHYSLFSIIPGIIGGILTGLCAMLLAQSFGELGLADYEPMLVKFTLPIEIAVIGTIVPTLIYFICAMLKVKSLLKADAVKLLSGAFGNDGSTHRIFTRSKIKVRFKYAFRNMLANPGRSFVVFLGIFLGAMIVTFAFSTIDSIKGVGQTAHNEFGNFKYEYILNRLENEKNSELEGEKMLILPFEGKEKKPLFLMSAKNDITLWNTEQSDGARADLSKGWYASRLCAALFKIKPGDKLSFRSIATLEEHTVEIKGIIQNGYQSFIISTPENLAKITKLDSSSFNTILSDKKLDIPREKLIQTISEESYENQMKNLLSSMSGVIYGLAVIGIIICIASLYASINMMLSENSHNISMLKVLGFDRRKINRMLINSNHILLIPGICGGIAFAYVMLVIFLGAFVEIEKMIIPAIVSKKSMLITIALTLACYFSSLILIKRKVSAVNMVEALKDNRE